MGARPKKIRIGIPWAQTERMLPVILIDWPSLAGPGPRPGLEPEATESERTQTPSRHSPSHGQATCKASEASYYEVWLLPGLVSLDLPSLARGPGHWEVALAGRTCANEWVSGSGHTPHQSGLCVLWGGMEAF